MARIPQPSLFRWNQIDAASDLDRLRLVLEALASVDEPLVRFLKQRRDKGRDDYPIRPTWNALIAGIVFPSYPRPYPRPTREDQIGIVGENPEGIGSLVRDALEPRSDAV